MDAGFIIALPFHHGDLEPDCVGVSTRGGGGGGGDKNTSARPCTKNAGGEGEGLNARRGIFARHYTVCV